MKVYYAIFVFRHKNIHGCSVERLNCKCANISLAHWMHFSCEGFWIISINIICRRWAMESKCQSILHAFMHKIFFFQFTWKVFSAKAIFYFPPTICINRYVVVAFFLLFKNVSEGHLNVTSSSRQFSYFIYNPPTNNWSYITFGIYNYNWLTSTLVICSGPISREYTETRNSSFVM